MKNKTIKILACLFGFFAFFDNISAANPPITLEKGGYAGHNCAFENYRVYKGQSIYTFKYVTTDSNPRSAFCLSPGAKAGWSITSKNSGYTKNGNQCKQVVLSKKNWATKTISDFSSCINNPKTFECVTASIIESIANGKTYINDKSTYVKMSNLIRTAANKYAYKEFAQGSDKLKAFNENISAYEHYDPTSGISANTPSSKITKIEGNSTIFNIPSFKMTDNANLGNVINVEIALTNLENPLNKNDISVVSEVDGIVQRFEITSLTQTELKVAITINPDALPKEKTSYGITIKLPEIEYKTDTKKIDKIYIYYLTSGGSKHQKYMSYTLKDGTNGKHQLSQLIQIQRDCQDCKANQEIKKPVKECEKDKDMTTVDITEPSLCSVISKCGTPDKTNKYVKTIGTCNVYCSDEISFDLFGKNSAVAGRVMQYNIGGPNNLGVLNVKRSCAAIAKNGGTCDTKEVKDYLSNMKPINCDSLLKNLDYSQGEDYNTFIKQILDKSIENTFTNVSFFGDGSCPTSYDEYCASNSGNLNTCSEGEMKCENGKNISQSDINNQTFTNITKIVMETSINITQTKNIYQKAYTDIIDLDKAGNSNWYDLGAGAWPIKNDMKTGKYKIGIIYRCLGAGEELQDEEFEYSCEYNVKNYSTIFTCDDEGITCFISKGQSSDSNPELAFFYRTVDLTRVFPDSRTTDDGNVIIGVNWQEAIDKYNANGIDLLKQVGENANNWAGTPEYTVTITPTGVKTLRKYNDSVNGDYQNNTITDDKCLNDGTCGCDSNGYCKSSVLNSNMDGVTVNKAGTYKNNIYTGGNN